jgi:hypothetical protein
MCVNNTLKTPAIFPFFTGSSEAFVAMDGIHDKLHYSKYVSEYNSRLARQ